MIDSNNHYQLIFIKILKKLISRVESGLEIHSSYANFPFEDLKIQLDIWSNEII